MRNIMIIAAAGAVSTPAWALPYAFEVEAEVSLVEDFNNLLGGTVYVGQPLLMTYAFDSDAIDLSSFPDVGYYDYSSGDYGMRVQVGPHDWRSDPGNLNFSVVIGDNNVNQDAYVLNSYNNIDVSGLAGPLAEMSWQLEDRSQTAWSSDALPTMPPDLGAFNPMSWLYLRGDGFDSFYVYAHATAVRALPRIVASSTPPNGVLFQGTGFTPGGRLVALTAASTGGGIVPGGACAGTNTGLTGPQMRTAFVADPDGTFSVSGRPGALSGQQLVVFDVATCTPSPPITLP